MSAIKFLIATFDIGFESLIDGHVFVSLVSKDLNKVFSREDFADVEVLFG